ncbi:MAG TPA: hypothetical protein VNF72_19500 [Myxococcota bacterium]|jgi:hypothetical protein|nr:hypothetical protein [Myxococcota bacterium]
MRGRARIVAVAGLAMASLAATGDANETRTDSAAARCGHVEELEAAKRAAELGDSEQVLLHLRKADALLARCMREGAPGPPMPSASSRVEAG